MKTIYAFTEKQKPEIHYPAYINVSEGVDDQIAINLRSTGAANSAAINLSMAEASAFNAQLTEYLEGKAFSEDVTVSINQMPITIPKNQLLSYENIAQQCGYLPNRNPSIVWCYARGTSGILSKGQSIAPRPGLIINCMITGNA